MTEKEVKGAFVSAQILMLAALEFVVLTLAAMFLYPGGSKFEMQSTHYLFLHNYFSDLGGTISYSGLSNLASSALFFVALTCIGTSLIFFSRAWKTIVWKGKQEAAASLKTCAKMFRSSTTRP